MLQITRVYIDLRCIGRLDGIKGCFGIHGFINRIRETVENHFVKHHSNRIHIGCRIETSPKRLWSTVADVDVLANKIRIAITRLRCMLQANNEWDSLSIIVVNKHIVGTNVVMTSTIHQPAQLHKSAQYVFDDIH